MTWQGTGTFCVAFTTLASNSGMCGTILYATSAPSGLLECRTVPASTCIFLMWNIYCDIAFRYFKTIFFVSFGCACVCTTLGVVHKKTRGRSRLLVWEGHWQEVPQRVPGAWQSPGEGLGASPSSLKNVTSWGWKKPLTERKSQSIQTVDIVWQYHNYHHLIHSSFYVSSHFRLKIQNAVCGLQSQQNSPQWQQGLKSVSLERNITVMSINL